MPDGPPPHPPSDNAKLIKASHVLIAYQGALDAAPTVTRDKETARKLANFVGIEARAGANFGDLAAKYSDDPKTKANDGRLGQISRTQMAKPFTDAAFGLMVNEVTIDPVETAFGFDIIKRTE
ncbi:MAG: peptidylprolyl isomerase [Pseudomonadota bacterium]